MNILFYPSWYQTTSKHNNGVFFLDQATAICKNCGHNIVFFITNITWVNAKFQLPKIKFEERRENNLFVWEYSITLPIVFKTEKAQEKISLELLKLAIAKMKRLYGKLDLIHAQSFLKAGYDACALHRKYNIPVVLTEHLSSVAGGLAPRAMEKFLFTIQEADKVVSVSTFLDSKISQFLSDQRKRIVIPNLVSDHFFYDSRIEKNNVFTFLSVGHLIPGKRVDFLINAFANAFTASDQVQLLIIGEGMQRNTLEQQVQQLSRTHQIKFLGEMTHEEVSERMKHANVFVHTSRLETFGVVLIEALASGLPVICTRCGGPEDILTNYGCTAVDIDSEEELITAMRQVMCEYTHYDYLKISRDAINRFGDRVVTQQINEVYKSVLERVKNE